MTDAATTESTQAAGAAWMRPGACGSCTLCCKVMGVPTLGKPSNSWCVHCKTGVGCGIYDTRPGECRNFICGFLSMQALPEEWRPLTSKLIIDTQSVAGTMYVYVDPSRPDAWKKEPYHQALRNWSRRVMTTNGRIVVRVGPRNIVVLPDSAVDLGAIAADEVIVILSAQRATSIDTQTGYQVFAVKTDVWQKTGLEVQMGTRVPALTEGYRVGRKLD